MSTARWGDLTDPLGCLTWDWVSMKGESAGRSELCLWQWGDVGLESLAEGKGETGIPAPAA